MVNLIMLQEKIKKSGLKKSFLAEALGMTATAFGRKLNGRNEFLLSEAVKLRKLLHLTECEWMAIFFNDDVTHSHGA